MLAPLAFLSACWFFFIWVGIWFCLKIGANFVGKKTPWHILRAISFIWWFPMVVAVFSAVTGLGNPN